MDKAVELAVRMTADASDLDIAFDSAGRSARAMGDDVADAARTAEAATRGLDRVGESADNLDDKAGKATGALGALSAGFELAGMEQYATGLQSAAMATDFLSGVGQSLTLVMELQVVATARAKVAAAAHAVATRAQAAATRVAAAGQWVLNAALAANPVGIVVVAVLALVAAVVVAYKRSETFRNIVQGAMGAARTAVGWVIDKVGALVEFVRDRAPAAFDKLKDKAVSAVQWIADKIGKGFEVVTAPIQAVIDLVQSVIDKIKAIDFPSPPDWLGDVAGGLGGLVGLGRVAMPTTPSSSSSGPTIDARTYVTIDGTGVVDEAAVARTLEPVLARHATRLGQLLPTITPASAW